MLGKLLVPALLTGLVAPSAAWEFTWYATWNIDTNLGSQLQTRTAEPVITPVSSSLAVTPTTTLTSIDYETILPDDPTLAGIVTVTVTTKYLMLPPTSLPVNDDPEDEYPSTTTTPTITTRYYAPVTISNLPSCTKTDYRYTESVPLFLPKGLRSQATDSSLAMYVTTYVSTISTNLGGQAVTTSLCEVYLSAEAVPWPEESGSVHGDRWRKECVDPRRETCTSGNTAATGTEGCGGSYPPTATDGAGDDEGNGESGDGEEEEEEGEDDDDGNGAGSWRSPGKYYVWGLPVGILGLALFL